MKIWYVVLFYVWERLWFGNLQPSLTRVMPMIPDLVEEYTAFPGAEM